MGDRSMRAPAKDVVVSVSVDMRIGELRLSINRMLEPELWRQRPLMILESELREMLIQMLAPSVTAYDQARQSLASGAQPPGG